MRASFLLLFVCFVQGCAIKGGYRDESSILRERAVDRWEALLNKNWEEAYSYELPEYRATHDVAKYKRRYGSSVQWLHVKIEAVEIKEDHHTADVFGELTFQFMAPGSSQNIRNTSEFRERWVKKDSEWWFTP